MHGRPSGSGRIVVKATRSLDASVTDDGVIQYEGNPAGIATSHDRQRGHQGLTHARTEDSGIVRPTSGKQRMPTAELTR